jgi:hypothetical protein
MQDGALGFCFNRLSCKEMGFCSPPKHVAVIDNAFSPPMSFIFGFLCLAAGFWIFLAALPGAVGSRVREETVQLKRNAQRAHRTRCAERNAGDAAGRARKIDAAPACETLAAPVRL